MSKLSETAVLNSINISLSHKYSTLSQESNEMIIKEKATNQLYKIRVEEITDEKK